MNTKAITRIVLLGVVAIAVGAWVIKEFGPSTTAASAGDGKPATAVIRPDGVTVINFHGEKRCRTCIGIGELAKQTIDQEFAAGQQSGKVRWEIINYDEAANTHYVKDYGLVSSTVVLTLWRDGREVEWKRLDAVWDHFGDEPAFRTYVSKGVQELLDRR